MAISNRAEMEAFVVSRCAQNWNEHELALRLATLGGEISRQISAPASLRGIAPEGLLSFIQGPLSGKVKVLRHPGKENVWGIIPIDAQIDDNQVEDLFRTPDYENAHARTARQEYLLYVWSAFKDPVDPDRQRFLFPGPNGRFQDYLMTEPKPAGGILIDRNLIVQRSGPLPPDVTKQVFGAIGAFITSTGIDIADISTAPSSAIAKTQLSDQSASEVPEADAHPNRLAIFLQGASVIPERDRSRISIPLDILIDLVERKS